MTRVVEQSSAQEGARAIGAASQAPNAAHPIGSAETSGQVNLPTLIDRRDELAYRKLRGETLTPREALMLRALNEIVTRALDPIPKLPQQVREVIDEVRLLRRR